MTQTEKKQRGRPKGKRFEGVTLTFQVPHELAAALKDLAEASHEKNLSQLLRAICADFVKRQDKSGSASE